MSIPVDSINSLATYFILLLFIYYLPRERRRFYINYFMPLYCRAAVLFCALSPWTQQSESACSNGGRARRNKARAPLFKLLMQWLQQAADINHLSQQLHVAPAPGSGRRMAALNSRCCIARSLLLLFSLCAAAYCMTLCYTAMVLSLQQLQMSLIPGARGTSADQHFAKTALYMNVHVSELLSFIIEQAMWESKQEEIFSASHVSLGLKTKSAFNWISLHTHWVYLCIWFPSKILSHQ
jgi:hypothetical protein